MLGYTHALLFILPSLLRCSSCPVMTTVLAAYLLLEAECVAETDIYDVRVLESIIETCSQDIENWACTGK